jgi:cystathionine beta-lyase
MIYDFDEILPRRASDSIKWNEYPADVLPMWVADMDFRSPEPVVRALKERVSHPVFGYPRDIPDLRQAIIAWLEMRYAWVVEPEEIIFIPGVIKGFNLAVQAFVALDGSVLVQPPIYPPILNAPELNHLSRQTAMLTPGPDGAYAIDFHEFEAQSEPTFQRSNACLEPREGFKRPLLFILCNPHNPTGRVLRREELERLAEICLRHEVLICSDEIHSDLVYPGNEHIPIASLDPQVARNTITLMAPSKTFNLPGLQFAYAIIQNEDLREQYMQVRMQEIHWVNGLGQVAALAAYREGEEWYHQVMDYIGDNRELVDEYVRSELPGVTMAKPEGTYLAWLDCRQAGIPGKPFEFFLEKARVALNDGGTFGPGGEGFVRLNFACPRPLLLEGLNRIKQSLAAL